MAKTSKNTTAIQAALNAAADSSKEAMKLAKTLPTKAAKKMRSLADEAKKASTASKKSIKRNPGEVVGRAIASVAGIATAIGRIPKAAQKKPTPQKPTPKTPTKTPAKTDSAVTSAAPAIDLSSLTVAQLKERAQKAGHTGFSRLTKAQLIDLLSS